MAIVIFSPAVASERPGCARTCRIPARNREVGPYDWDWKEVFSGFFNEATSFPGPLSKDDLLYNVHCTHRVRILISASLKFCVKVHLPATVAENLDHEPCSPWIYGQSQIFSFNWPASVKQKYSQFRPVLGLCWWPCASPLVRWVGCTWHLIQDSIGMFPVSRLRVFDPWIRFGDLFNAENGHF